MCTLLFMMICFVSKIYGSDSATQMLEQELRKALLEEKQKVNARLMKLIEENNIVGHTVIEDGGNLATIQEYVEQNKVFIDFSISVYVRGCGYYTPLGRACEYENCSPMVVDYLCELGADPNDRGTRCGKFPGTLCISTLSNFSSNYDDQYQCRKLTTLKLFCAQKNKKLSIDAHVQRLWSYTNRRNDPRMKEFLADTEFV